MGSLTVLFMLVPAVVSLILHYHYQPRMQKDNSYNDILTLREDPWYGVLLEFSRFKGIFWGAACGTLAGFLAGILLKRGRREGN
jgi:hypothetical protein